MLNVQENMTNQQLTCQVLMCDCDRNDGKRCDSLCQGSKNMPGS